jgi:hypothetical protein
MSQPLPITDQQIDALIEQVRPQLRQMIRGVFQGEPLHFLEIGKMPLPSGQTWQVVIAVMNEAFAGVASGTLMVGLPAFMKAYEKMNKPAAVPVSEGAFSIPGS